MIRLRPVIVRSGTGRRTRGAPLGSALFTLTIVLLAVALAVALFVAGAMWRARITAAW